MPYTMNDLDDVRIYYAFAGIDGPPLVLIHDTGASSAIWKQLGYVDRLASDYRLVMIDARGHGRSDKPDDESAYTMPLLVADVVAVLDRAGIERAHMLGYGMGGQVACSLGIHAPERVDSLIVGGTILSLATRSIDSERFRVPMPILLFAGEDDPDGLRDAQVSVDQLPSATLAVIPGETHASTISRADKVMPHVLAFLARLSGSQLQAA